MYMGDHIVISIGLAAIVAKITKQPFVTVALLFLFANLVDFDHLLNYHLDDGTANSMQIHPLHRYAPYIASGFLLVGLCWKKWRTELWIASLAFSTHILLDSLSAVMDYRIPLLLSTSVVTTSLSCYVVHRLFQDKSTRDRLLAFMLSSLILCDLELIVTVYVLKMIPQTNLFFWVIPPTLLLFLSGLFWMCFRERDAVSGAFTQLENV